MNSKMLTASAAMALAVGTLAFAGPAPASTLTFETAPSGPGFSGPVTENGFTYSTLSGGLYVNELGNPGQDMEGEIGADGGVLDIVSATAADFTFSSLDYSAYDESGAGSQTLTVSGFLNGSLVGTDTYTLANTANFNPSFDNWTLESASNLAGVTIDDLQITLNAGFADSFFGQNIDNVTLSGGVPEPAAWALLLAGFAGLGMALRARRKLASAI